MGTGIGWLDDLGTRISQAADTAKATPEYATIETYLKTRAVEEVVKVIKPPTGNLTAAQIAAGQTGQPQQNQVIAVPQSIAGLDPKILIMGGIALVGLYFLMGSKR